MIARTASLLLFLLCYSAAYSQEPIERTCHTDSPDGTMHWYFSTYKDSQRNPVSYSFYQNDEKDREILRLRQGVSYRGMDTDFWEGGDAKYSHKPEYDTTEYLAVHSFYDSADNYAGEKLYIYSSIQDFRNGVGTLVRHIAYTYGYDSYGNWIYRSVNYNGVPGTTTRRVITYHADIPEATPEKREDLR